MLYEILLRSHSGLRWVVFILIVAVVVKALPRLGGKVAPDKMDKRLSTLAMASVHLQVVIGLVLYIMSPRVQFSGDTMGNTMFRFFTVEHAFGMLIGLILVTLAHRRSKGESLKKMFWFYVAGLLVILISIPWPFRGLGTGWF